jgi:syntaxin 8
MANPSQLFLLADHIKLSLLERQRAIALDLEPNAQDGNISRSLESMREGLQAIDDEVSRLQSQNDPYAAYNISKLYTCLHLIDPHNHCSKML